MMLAVAVNSLVTVSNLPTSVADACMLRSFTVHAQKVVPTAGTKYRQEYRNREATACLDSMNEKKGLKRQIAVST